MAYAHRRLWHLKPRSRSDVVDHPDILLITLKGPCGPFNLLNVYSDGQNNLAIKLLSERRDIIPELGYMGGDFNCPSPLWDASPADPHLPKPTSFRR
jgi:hypothetical protein